LCRPRWRRTHRLLRRPLPRPRHLPEPQATPPVRFDWQGAHKKAQAALAQRDYKTAIQLFTDIINSGRLPKTGGANLLSAREGVSQREEI